MLIKKVDYCIRIATSVTCGQILFGTKLEYFHITPGSTYEIYNDKDIVFESVNKIITYIHHNIKTEGCFIIPLRYILKELKENTSKYFSICYLEEIPFLTIDYDLFYNLIQDRKIIIRDILG